MEIYFQPVLFMFYWAILDERYCLWLSSIDVGVLDAVCQIS